MFKRYEKNPVLKPLKDHAWESKRVFNCAAVYEKGKVHIVYRAQGEDGISRLGYASSFDGYRIDERLDLPIFSPATHFETFGCEDPRVTKIENDYYMCYTAYSKFRRWSRVNSKMRLAQAGLTSISVNNFFGQEWSWKKRVYPFPLTDSKNMVLFPRKFNGKYVVYHRIPPHIWIAYSDNLEDWSQSHHKIVMQPRETWENVKIGAGAPPIKTEKGWLFVYHGIDEHFTYRLGLALIDPDDPETVRRSRKPIFEPKEKYEQNIVFSCGAVVMDGKLFIYYGAADRVIGVATADVSELLSLFET
ncbi:MAG: glycosidase [Candidatus Bathyarchaeota archaeon]